MADPLTITTVISGLLPLVRENFAILRDAFIPVRMTRHSLARMELQKTTFQAWDECWTDSDGRLDQKISGFATTNPLLARGILQQLVLLLRTLSDPEKLKRYGLTLQTASLHRNDDLAVEMKYVCGYLYDIDSGFSAKHLAIFNESRIRHMTLLQSVRFTLNNIAPELELDDLIFRRLDEFNRSLRLLTPPMMSATIDRKVFELVVKDVVKDVERTRRFEAAAAYEAKHTIDPGAKANYEAISKLANFSMAVQASNADMSRKKIFSLGDFSFDSPYYFDKNTTLARLFDYPTKYQSRLVLVEWVALARHASTSSILETLDETKVTWYILHAEKPQKILLPATIGLIFDESNPRSIGIVYQLPSHIRGNLPTKPGGRVIRSPKAIAAERMPTSLRQLILKKDPDCSDLGIRFKLAKQVIDAVYLMHTAKFTHRNIRPDNILLFPSLGANGDPDPSRLDYDNPVIFGFHDARLETQFSPDTPPTYPQPTGLKPILKNPNRKPPREVIIDCYTHPERRLAAAADPRAAPFRRQHDLYGVGCVLLELGLWETLDGLCGREIGLRAPLAGGDFENGPLVEEDVWKDAEVVRRVARGLDVITGSVYAEVTRMCLSLNPISGDILEFERRAAAMLAQIAA